jgi:hypothetical protein
MPVCIWKASPPSSNAKIGYKTALPTPTHAITGFGVPLRSPIYRLSLLFSPAKFSTNKIFPASAVGVCLCFQSQSRLKNPEHLKLLHVSSVHHIWRCTKGPAITWGWYRLCQTGKGCLRMWPWASGTWWSLFSRKDPPPRPSYSGTLRSTFSPSLSVLLRRVSSLGNWGKGPSPLQLYRRQSEETGMPGRNL